MCLIAQSCYLLSLDVLVVICIFLYASFLLQKSLKGSHSGKISLDQSHQVNRGHWLINSKGSGNFSGARSLISTIHLFLPLGAQQNETLTNLPWAGCIRD